MSLKKLVLLAFLVILFSFSAASVFDYAFSESASSGPFHIKGEKHLKNIKMLTNGGENAEAYLSFNEEKLIYQASTGSLKCDQIFTMNINGSNKKNGLHRKGKNNLCLFPARRQENALRVHSSC